MTPKEKAEQIIYKFIDAKLIKDDFFCEEINQYVYSSKEEFERAKKCALIAVDELINDCDASSPFEEQRLKFWNDVKSELS